HLGHDGGLFLMSLKGSPHGRILRVPAAKPTLADAKVIVPEGKSVIESFEVAPHRLYVTMLVGGPNELDVYDLAAKKLSTVPLAPVTNVEDLTVIDGDDALVRTTTYTEPPQWQHLHAANNKLSRTALVVTSPVDLSGYQVTREEATSKDGTKVPMSVLRK